MSQTKGYQPSKKCATYIKKMISQQTWKVVEQITPLQKIAFILGISYPTVRKVVRQFEKDGIFTNWGNMGFYLVTPTKRVSKYRTCLDSINSYLNAFTLSKAGAIRIAPWLIKYEKDTDKITGLNEVNGMLIDTQMKYILEIFYSLIPMDSLLKIKNTTEFEEQKIKFDNQRKILPLARIILKHKKDFGIDERSNLYR